MSHLNKLTRVLLTILVFTNRLQALSIERNTPHQITWVEDVTLLKPGHSRESADVELTFFVHGQEEQLKFQLVPNHEILSSLKNVHHLQPDGAVTSIKPFQRSRHSILKGHVLVQNTSSGHWNNVGTARISLRESGHSTLFEGTFTVGNDLYYAQVDFAFRQTTPGLIHNIPDESTKPFVVLRREGDLGQRDNHKRELSGDEPVCGLNGRGSTNLDSIAQRQTYPRHGSLAGYPLIGLEGRQNTQGLSEADLIDSIGSTDGCPTTRLIALLGIATDCSYTAAFGSLDEVEAHIISEVNAASEVYEDTFNIALAIHNLSISDASCSSTSGSGSTDWNVPCSDDADTRARLSLFSAWRGRQQDDNALWTLLSGCRTDSTVGISWLGQVCQQGSQSSSTQTSSSTNIVVRNSQEWQVIAHEIGHSFGATHDCTADTCGTRTTDDAQPCCPLSEDACDADAQYIMNPSPRSGIRGFSPCSVGAICSSIGRGLVRSDCLGGNQDATVIDTPTCATGPSGSDGCDFTAPTTAPTDPPGISNFGDTNGSSRSWFDEHRNTVIIVASVVGSVCLIAIVGCVFFLARRKRRRQRAKAERVRALEGLSRVYQRNLYM